MSKIRLTQLSDAGGCGCKIPPDMLSDLLQDVLFKPESNNIIAGNDNNEDAAVVKLSDSEAIIFSNDFFTPIVDDPYDFGKIASCNALSDIYAMGGIPKFALSILGFPKNTISSKIVNQVLKGAKDICNSVGISLVGGHSINNPQPIFGLSVVGFINPQHVKLNSTGKSNDLLYLTKPIGTGIYSTALKKGMLKDDDLEDALNIMSTLNSIGTKIAGLSYVNSLTDVSGYGLIGHLYELCNSSGLQAALDFSIIPVLKNVDYYFQKGIITSGGKRNLKFYKPFISYNNPFKGAVLCDPQTNGGLLVTVNPNFQNEFEYFLKNNHLNDFAKPIGRLNSHSKSAKTIEIL